MNNIGRTRSFYSMSSDPDPLPSSSKGLQLLEYTTLHSHRASDESDKECTWRRHCGCLKTSEKLKKILEHFPGPPPPPPSPNHPINLPFENTCISAYCTQMHQPLAGYPEYRALVSEKPIEQVDLDKQNRVQRLLSDLVQLIQVSVTAAALALYYLIYCYMQLIYFTLKSAMYFHNADGPMKITIGVVTVTSLVVGFNLLLRVEKFVGIVF